MTQIRKPGVLGFGTGHLYGGATRGAALALVHAAWEAGIRWFDTAPLYGHGAAEGILGEALRGRRAEATIVSKVGIAPVRINLAYRAHAQSARVAARIPGLRRLLPEPAPLHPLFHQFSPASVRASVERSLKVLRTDYLDLLLLHECTPEEAADALLLETLDALKREGKIRAYGAATSRAATAQIAARPGAALDAYQFEFQPDGPPCAPPGALLMAHSLLGARLAELERRLAQEPAAREAARALAIDPERPDMARRLLAAAAQEHDAVLFSTSRPERVEALARARDVSKADAAACLTFVRWAAAPPDRLGRAEG